MRLVRAVRGAPVVRRHGATAPVVSRTISRMSPERDAARSNLLLGLYAATIGLELVTAALMIVTVAVLLVKGKD